MSIKDKIRRIREGKKLEKPDHWRDLNDDEISHMAKHSTCPYCHSNLSLGPEAGLSINLFCSNIECRARFNWFRLPGGGGEFTMTEKREMYER